MMSIDGRGKIPLKHGTPMNRTAVEIAIGIHVAVIILLLSALRWTAGYDEGPVRAFALTVPGGHGDVGVDSWRLLSGVWISLYRCPPQGGLTTILDFTLPKLWYVVMCVACAAMLIFNLLYLGRLLRHTQS
jgi:hypothetical protein